MFTGWDDDGSALYDTKESAIERAKTLKKWDKDPSTKIFIQRDWTSSVWLSWFAHLVRETPLQWLAYKELIDD